MRAAAVAALLMASCTSSAAAATRLVDDDKAECPNAGFTSIAAAATGTQPNDQIVICDGTYAEAGIALTGPLTLKGAGADRVRIQAPAPLSDYVLHAGGGPVNISGVTIAAGAPGATPSTVEGGVSFEAGGGLRASRITNLAASAAAGQGIGVFAEGGAGATYTIEGSLFEGYGQRGLSFESGAGTLTAAVRDNVIHGRGPLSADAQDGILVDQPSSGMANVTIARNVIADHRHTPDERQAAGVRVLNGAAPTIHENDIQGNGYGVSNDGLVATCPLPSAPSIDAENNWWGNPDGATDPPALCPVGPVMGSPAKGDRVSEKVDADPSRGTPRGAPVAPAPQPDSPPQVSIATPDGTAAEPGTPVTVTATASDDFDVKRVEFRRGATLLATTAAPPSYSAAVNAPAAGTSQVVTATAIDSSGQSAVAAISLRGTLPPQQPETPQAPAEPEDRPPTVAITSPAAGSQIDPAAAPRITADAADDRGVARVVFFDDGQQVCSDDTAPYDCAYAPNGGDVGRNTLIAIALDGAGQGGVDFRAVEVRRFNPKLTARTTPKRDRRRPYRYTTTGSVLLPAGVTPEQACSGGGSVAIEFRAGKLRLPMTAALRSDCSFRTSIAFPSRRSLGSGRIAVTAKFGGNTVLGTAKARSQKVRAG